MRICLKCRSVSARNASYCGRCGGAFGGLRCSSGHLSPGLAKRSFCPVCRTAELVQPVPSMNLGIVTRIVAWGLALLALKYLFAHLGLIAHELILALEWIIGKCVVGFLGSILSLLFALWVFIRCIAVFNPEYARSIDPFPKLVPMIWKGSIRALSWFGRTLFLLVEGRALPASKDNKRKPKEGS